MRRILAITAVVAVGAALALAAVRIAPVRSISAPRGATPPASAAKDAYVALPLRFEPNVGQADDGVTFLSRGHGYTMLMTRTGAVLKLGGPAERPPRPSGHPASKPAEQARIGLTFAGANPDPVVAGRGRLESVSNYLLGSDPDRWFSGVPNYARVSYRNLYDGVSLEYYANRTGELEFDLTLAPGVDPDRIRLSYSGADELRIDPSGALVLRAGDAQIRQAPPVVYQWVDGVKREVQGRYVVRGASQVGFVLATYDRSIPLVIDPVITYSTYLGGSGDEFPIWSAIDRAGNFYVTGFTNSPDFPTTGESFQPTFGGGDGDAFVAKLNRSGSGLVWSTYLGGDAFDVAIGLDVDRHGNVVVTGETGSTGFPTTPDAFQPTFAGGPTDAFVTKLNAKGSKLLFSTFLGGAEGFDVGFISFFDKHGNVHVEGDTGSPDFPTTPGSFQPTFGGGPGDGFVVKLRPNGARLVYSTFIGGSGADGAHGRRPRQEGQLLHRRLHRIHRLPHHPGGVPTHLRRRDERRLGGQAEQDRHGPRLLHLPGRRRRRGRLRPHHRPLRQRLHPRPDQLGRLPGDPWRVPNNLPGRRPRRLPDQAEPGRHQGHLLDLPGRERLRPDRDSPRQPPRRRPRRRANRLDRLPGDQRGDPGNLRWRPRRRLPAAAQPGRVAAQVRQLPGRQRRGRQRGGRLLAGRQGKLVHPRRHQLDRLPGNPGRVSDRQRRRVRRLSGQGRPRQAPQGIREAERIGHSRELGTAGRPDPGPDRQTVRHVCSRNR
jgi:hypothetical protein